VEGPVLWPKLRSAYKKMDAQTGGRGAGMFTN
jgi:hypothetical protein